MGLHGDSSSHSSKKRPRAASVGAGTAAPSSSVASNMKIINESIKGKATLDQFNADAGLLAEFERSDRSSSSFDYSKSVHFPPQSVPEEQVAIYLSKIQRGGFIQPVGCMLAVEEESFRIIAYSENCFDLLVLNSIPETVSKGETGLIGTDARTLFSPPSGASLARAAAARELSFLNPVWVYSRGANKPFYAILHRVDVGIVIDLEPARSNDPAFPRAGAARSQKLAAQAISRLQSLHSSDVGVLCDTVVEDVQRLTGFDRVMVYKFHDDEHGEVVSEIRREDLDPYLGLHYPATDIPQAARFLFKQNRVRMICDCNANQVRVIQSEELKQPLLLSNSTLRSPHGCHSQYMANMNSIASLVLSVTINGNDSTKLWGLVVGHHTSPRYVPFPQRYACGFLMQAFGLQLYMELQLAAHLQEKKVLRTQTLLCDMLLHDAPLGIVTQSPSIMDLVRCEGAALYHGEKCWLLGVTPTESQVKDIVKWLLDNHGDSTGLTIDSLVDSGYPGAGLLGDIVCGMAAAKITTQDFLFWFRSHTANEIKWAGAKHRPEDKDNGAKMHPRSSFKAFLEVVKSKSLPWEVSEINAIHSLQLIMRDSLQEMEDMGAKAMVCSQQMDTEMERKNQMSSVASEMIRLVETATAPIFGVDLAGLVNGWNAKVADLTGLKPQEAMGKSLVHDIVHEDSKGEIESLLTKALQGEEDKNVELKLRTFGPPQENSVIFIMVNACISRDYTNNIIGICFVGQDITREKIVSEKFTRLEGDYKAIIHSLNPFIPPIFASDENACCSEWNSAMQKLTGWSRPEVIGKVLPGEIFGGLCQLRGQDSMTKFMILLYMGISGRDTDNLQLGFYDRDGNLKDVVITANRRSNAQGDTIGCVCFLQIVDPGIEQHPLEVDRQDDGHKLRELAYIRQQMTNPLSGIRFTHMLLETTATSEYQKQFLETSEACGRQMMAIVKDAEYGRIEQGKVEFCMEEFILGNVLDAIVCQVMISVMEKQIQLLHEVPEEAKTLSLYGDQIMLQLVLSNFLLSIVHHTPSNGWVEIKVLPGFKLIQDGHEYIRLQFRMTHPGEGLPGAVVQDMVEGENRWATQDGLGLNLSRKLLNRMNGRVRYNREQNKCYFLIDLEFRTKEGKQKGFLPDY